MSEETGPQGIAKKIIDQGMQKTISQAEKGDSESICEIMKIFCNAVKSNTGKSGNPLKEFSPFIEWPYIEYLAKCFNEVLRDSESIKARQIKAYPDMARAFGFTSSIRGAKKKFGTDERDQMIWLLVTDKAAFIRKARTHLKKKNSKFVFDENKHQPLQRAIKQVANILKRKDEYKNKYYDISDSTVRAAYMKINKRWFPRNQATPSKKVK